jgi:hypothetical protein
LHELEEYMEEVELWFRKYEMSHPRVRRKIYLATDEPKVSRYGVEQRRTRILVLSCLNFLENSKICCTKV